MFSMRFPAIGASAGRNDKENAMDRRNVLKAAAFVAVGAGLSPMSSKARAFDEKVESLIGDSHDGANRIQDPHWCKGGQS
jgi:hypothetical protein